MGRWGGSRVGGPVAIASGAARDATPSRDGAVGRLGRAPRNNRSRAHYEVRRGRNRWGRPWPRRLTPHRVARRRAPGPADPGSMPARRAVTPKRKGAEKSLSPSAGRRETGRIEKQIRRSRGVPRPPQDGSMSNPPADRPAILRARLVGPRGSRCCNRLFDRLGRRARRVLNSPSS